MFSTFYCDELTGTAFDESGGCFLRISFADDSVHLTAIWAEHIHIRQ